MKTLFLKINEIKTTCKNENDFYSNKHEIAVRLCEEYPNIPIDIMEHYFVKHSNQGLETLRELPDIDISSIKVCKKIISCEDIINKNKIENAPFTSYDEPELYKGSILNQQYNWYKNDYLKNGSWDYPIVTLKDNDKLWVIDGTNRFRHMLICLKNNFDFIAQKHAIYILEGLKRNG